MDSKCTSTRQRDTAQASMQAVRPLLSCPMCGGESISTKWAPHTFEYGSDESQVELKVCIPMRHCDACEFEYLDDESERRQHDAVCDHLGVLPPDKIRHIRKEHGMTRAAFAQVTGLGEASLHRWENGLSIQTHANDRYLRLLQQPQNLSRLQNHLAARHAETLRHDVETAKRFQALKVTPHMLRQQEFFRLMPHAA